MCGIELNWKQKWTATIWSSSTLPNKINVICVIVDKYFFGTFVTIWLFLVMFTNQKEVLSYIPTRSVWGADWYQTSQENVCNSASFTGFLEEQLNIQSRNTKSIEYLSRVAAVSLCTRNSCAHLLFQVVPLVACCRRYINKQNSPDNCSFLLLFCFIFTVSLSPLLVCFHFFLFIFFGVG